jgi:UDP-glucose 4-epimerase
MKILLTGSSGYVGKSFMNLYKNKYTFEMFSLLKNSLENIDFSDVNTVLHCAALVHKKREYSYDKYYEVNAEYPLRLAERAKACGVKQFVFMSSVAVYGEGHSLLNEQTACTPTTFYGGSKLMAEQELKKLEDENFRVSIVRAPMVYGQNAPGNIASLINLVKKISLLPFGEIHNKRSFVYVKNLCHFLDVIIEKQQSGIFLASDDEAPSTTKLIELIAKNLEKKVYLIKVPFFESLLKFTKPSLYNKLYGNLEIDNTLTKKRLNFKNLYTLEQGVKEMIRGEVL